MNAAGIELLKRFEGYREQAYRDAVGVWTIGYGFTKNVKPGQRMSRDEAEQRLIQEVAVYERAALTACTRRVTPNQLAALTSLFYNVGTGWIRKSSVIRAHNRGDLKGVQAGFAAFVKAGGRVLPGLVRRRNAEIALYMDGAEDNAPADADQQAPVEPAGKPLLESKTAWSGATLGAIPSVLGALQGFNPWVAGLAILALALGAFVVWDRWRKAREAGV